MSQIHILTSNVLIEIGLVHILSQKFSADQLTCLDSVEATEESLTAATTGVLVVCSSNIKDFNIVDCIDIIRKCKDLKVLIIGNSDNEKLVLQLLENGVDGFITDECDETEIVEAVEAMFAGKKFYCNKALDIIVNKTLYQEKTSSCDATSLSQRELEIVKHLAQGQSNKQVADHFNLSPHTIHTHRKNIMKKLNTRTISELTIYCVNMGIIQV